MFVQDAVRFVQQPYDVDNNVRLTLWLARQPMFRAISWAYVQSLSPAAREQFKTLTPIPIDWSYLETLPEGTLGREFADMEANYGIEIRRFHKDTDAFEVEPWPVARFLKTHDLHHLVAGIPPTSELNEIALQGLILGMGHPDVFAYLSDLGMPLIALRTKAGMISSWRAWFRHVWLGFNQHRGTDIIMFPYEYHWGTPLTDLRERLGLPRDGFGGVDAHRGPADVV